MIRPDAGRPQAGTSAFDILEPKQPGYLGIAFRVRASGYVFRLRPVRCPDQPRFWCFRVCRTLRGDAEDPAYRPWIGANRLRREELPAAVEDIRADIDGWLARPGQRAMRDWILGDGPDDA
jgi:hypothetical protein